MQDTVDQHLRSVQMPPIMQTQFGGTQATRIICRGLPYRSHKEEDFVQVEPAALTAAWWCGHCMAVASAGRSSCKQSCAKLLAVVDTLDVHASPRSVKRHQCARS